MKIKAVTEEQLNQWDLEAREESIEPRSRPALKHATHVSALITQLRQERLAASKLVEVLKIIALDSDMGLIANQMRINIARNVLAEWSRDD